MAAQTHSPPEWSAMWQALKDDLCRRIDADDRVHRELLADGDPSLAPFGALLVANRSTLAKMRELEKEPPCL